MFVLKTLHSLQFEVFWLPLLNDQSSWRPRFVGIEGGRSYEVSLYLICDH